MVETMVEVNTSWLHRVSAKRRTVDIEEQRSIAWRGLQEYLRTVSLRGCAREEKLQRIADLFTVDAALITPGGEVLEGHEGVKQFYGSDESPVMQRADFMPRPVTGTLRFSLDGRSLSIEIDLPSQQVIREDGTKYSFDVDPFRKNNLLNGFRLLLSTPVITFLCILQLRGDCANALHCFRGDTGNHG